MFALDYIGKELSFVSDELEKQGYNVQLIDNNFNVDGDISLVTNIKIKGKNAKVYFGKFIFAVNKG